MNRRHRTSSKIESIFWWVCSYEARTMIPARSGSAPVGDDGYGRFCLMRDGRQRVVRPHRYALARALTEEVAALHLCDNPIVSGVRHRRKDAVTEPARHGSQGPRGWSAGTSPFLR